MRDIEIGEVADAIGGELPFGGGERVIESGVSTDSRSLSGTELFVALRGERFDGHDFAQAAVDEGCPGVLLEDDAAVGEAPGTIVIEDSLLALQRLARWWRCELGLPVVGLTGSNGKTSTKDFTKAVLAQRYSVCATQGNLNNHIGVPLSVLSLDDEHEVGVFEMGMNHPGEIAPLCEIAKPHLGIITNIGTAHIEHMGSRDGIAEEKGALARALPEVGTLFVPASCDYLNYLRDRTRARTVAVGNGRGEVRAEEIDASGETMKFVIVVEDLGRAPVELPVAGRHMITNALLAAAVGRELGVSLEGIVSGLMSTELTSGRLRCFESNGVRVFDDTYNANPDSMKAGLETLAEAKGERKFAVLGMMAELGEHAVREHLEVGRYAAELGVQVASVGEEAKGITEGASGNGVRHFDERSEAAAWLKEEVKAGDVILFKGSRAAAIEQVMKQVFP